MQVGRAKTEPRGARSGRHRLPRHAGAATPVETSPASGLGGDAGEGDLEEEHFPTAHEIPAAVDHATDETGAATASPPAGGRWGRRIGYGLIPSLTIALGSTVGYMAWGATSAHFVQQSRIESVRAATEGAVALLAYRSDTVGQELGAARELLTGKFKASYASFTHEHVIPDARTKHISSVVTVPAAAIVRATIDHAVVMVCVNQTFLHDPDPPTSTASDVRVTLDKVGRRWLISDFSPLG